MKVFISYSHDSQEHEQRVLALSDRLRADGIEIILSTCCFPVVPRQRAACVGRASPTSPTSSTSSTAKTPTLCIIPRDTLKPEFILHEERYRISRRLKNEPTLKAFLHAI